MVLNGIVNSAHIKIGLESEDKDELFEEMVDFFVSQNPTVSRDALISALWARESKLSTGISKGFALPHAQLDSVKQLTGLIGLSRQGIDYDALDGKPVHVVFMLFSNSESTNLYLRTLKKISLLVKKPMFLEELLVQSSNESLIQVIQKYEEGL